MGTAIKHPVPDRIKLSCVIFDIRALWRSVGVKGQTSVLLGSACLPYEPQWSRSFSLSHSNITDMIQTTFLLK